MPDARFKVTTNLVQVDVIVSGPLGKPVEGLKAEDFEIREDGRPQPIANFSGAEHRSVALLADSCNYADIRLQQLEHPFLEWLISGSVRQGDRFLILSGSVGSAAVQRFTDEPELLRRQLEQQHLPARLMSWCFPPLLERYPVEMTREEYDRIRLCRADDRERALWPTENQTLLFQDLSLAIDLLKEQPGRKDLVYIGNLMLDKSRTPPALRELISRANRAGVTLHALSPGKNIASPPADKLKSPAWESQVFFDATMETMAHETGGLFFEYPNAPRVTWRKAKVPGGKIASLIEDPNENIIRFLEDSWKTICTGSGFYTLWYRPEAVSGDFHKLDVRVKRPALTLHTRKGYYDSPQPPAVSDSSPEPLSAVLDSPLHNTSIGLTATPLDIAEQEPPGRLRKFRTVIRLVLSIDPRDLSWAERAGRKQALVELAAVAHGEEHRVVSTAGKNCEPAWPGDSPGARTQCVLDMAFDHPGLYVVRAAIRDQATGRNGSAYTVAPVSEHNVSRMTLSEILLHGDEGQILQAEFAPGASVGYQLEAYGMKLDEHSRQANLTVRIGVSDIAKSRPVFHTAETPVNTDGATWRASIKGKVTLPKDLEPGDYAMEVLVSDKLGNVDLMRFSEFRVP